ncbi:MAG: carotenoid oxygenase family protein [Gammaproteobacteria bacterium]
MNPINLNLTALYASQLQELSLARLSYDGVIPTWLSGSFISNGPAQFEVGNTQFNHWLDGFAMLKKFTFHAGQVSFQNRFLRSKQYIKSNADKKLYFNEFDTYADTSWPSRLMHSLHFMMKPEMYDNCSVNTTRIADNYIAMTETSAILSFNANDLQTQGLFTFTDNMQGQMSLAHPQLDITTREMINITTDIGKDIQYHIYKVAPGKLSRELIKTYRSDKLFYIHSFSITPNYVILFKSPLVGSKLKLMLNLPFNKTLTWEENVPSYFIIINRHNGEVTEVEAEPFICLHSVNAFESANEIILDLICYENGNPYNELCLANLRSATPKFMPVNLRRYTINMTAKKCGYLVLEHDAVEFPRINYMKANGQNYQFAYMALLTDQQQHSIFNAIQKIDMNTACQYRWQKAGYYPGEPIFIARPQSVQEDDGVVIFIAFCVAKQCSALIILDARDMQQLAEIQLPIALPLGLHGNFYADVGV